MKELHGWRSSGADCRASCATPEIGVDHRRVVAHDLAACRRRSCGRSRARRRGRRGPSPRRCRARSARRWCRASSLASRMKRLISCFSCGVHAGHRLVEQQQLRLGGQRARRARRASAGRRAAVPTMRVAVRCRGRGSASTLGTCARWRAPRGARAAAPARARREPAASLAASRPVSDVLEHASCP